MADHTCNSNVTTDLRDLIRVDPGGKKTYQLWQEKSCDVCGKLASKVNMGTEEQ